jgi:lysophospholipase L1-like esterase
MAKSKPRTRARPRLTARPEPRRTAAGVERRAAVAPAGWAGTIGTRVVNTMDLMTEDPATKPDGGLYGSRFLGEGDSWFSVNAVPWSANTLEQLQFSRPSIVVTLAQPGDTVRRMTDLTRNPRLEMFLANPRFAYRWDAVFFSGGGNDIIDAAGSIIVRGAGTDPAAYVDAVVLERSLDGIRAGYRDLVELRDRAGSPNRGRPIVAHTYDYATPRNSPAQFFSVPAVGPWLYRALTLAGVNDPDLQRGVADRIFDALADALVALAGELPGLVVVDTRGTLVRARAATTGNDNDWLNEIHPNTGGYRKIAARIVRDL